MKEIWCKGGSLWLRWGSHMAKTQEWPVRAESSSRLTADKIIRTRSYSYKEVTLPTAQVGNGFFCRVSWWELSFVWEGNEGGPSVKKRVLFPPEYSAYTSIVTVASHRERTKPQSCSQWNQQKCRSKTLVGTGLQIRPSDDWGAACSVRHRSRHVSLYHRLSQPQHPDTWGLIMRGCGWGRCPGHCKCEAASVASIH